MNADLTISTLSYKHASSKIPGESLRREVARGAMLPTVLSIKSTDAVDSKTKRPQVRTNVSFAHHMAMSDGQIEPVLFYVVMAAPKDPLVTAAIQNGLVNQAFNLLCGTTNTDGLDLKEEIFSGLES